MKYSFARMRFGTTWAALLLSANRRALSYVKINISHISYTGGILHPRPKAQRTQATTQVCEAKADPQFQTVTRGARIDPPSRYSR
jgi:hypothetical protein